jgi:hypothetical protein
MLTVMFRLEPLVSFCRGQRVATAAAETEQTKAFSVDSGVLRNEVRHAFDILDAVRRFVNAATLPRITP